MMSLMSVIIDHKCCCHMNIETWFSSAWLTKVYSQSLTVHDFFGYFSLVYNRWHKCSFGFNETQTPPCSSHSSLSSYRFLWFLTSHNGSGIRNTVWIYDHGFFQVFSRSSFSWSVTIQISFTVTGSGFRQFNYASWFLLIATDHCLHQIISLDWILSSLASDLRGISVVQTK